MEITNKPTTNVEELMLRLLRQKTTKEHFKLNFSKQESENMLLAAVMAEVKYRHGEFKPSEQAMHYISQAAQWLTSDKHKVGLMLCGLYGNGKTTLMAAIASLINYLNLKNEYGQRLEVVKTDARHITELAKTNYKQYKEFYNKPMLAIDDLGTEPTEVLDFGNVLNPVIDLLYHRYNYQLFTIVTTNIKPSDIRAKYGDRVADRFNEMMEKITFGSPSYRGR